MGDRVDEPGGRTERVKELLARARNGEPEAKNELAHLVHGELHGMACRFMADQRPAHTLQPTALVNEAWLRIAHGSLPAGRAAFLAVAAASMRSILVDHARRRCADKRGGGRQALPLDEAGGVAPAADADDGSAMLALHDVLERLTVEAPDAARVAEMRLFGGMEHAEVAEVTGSSLRSVQRLWSTARTWLQRELG